MLIKILKRQFMPTPLQLYLPSLPPTKQEQQNRSAQQSEHEKRLQELELYKLLESVVLESIRSSQEREAYQQEFEQNIKSIRQEIQDARQNAGVAQQKAEANLQKAENLEQDVEALKQDVKSFRNDSETKIETQKAEAKYDKDEIQNKFTELHFKREKPNKVMRQIKNFSII
ncbi:MAG: hypothetical protein HWD61_06700 [Parachlamydiaceae bacterium]|nr:MAG: hypothetical protein HWD61_06700 [Parachlamydiaceae bacterium]